MKRHVEKDRQIGVVETRLRPISDLPSERLRQSKALDRQFLFDNLQPGLIQEIKVALPDGTITTFGIFNVISPYTEGGIHVMILDNSGKYRPTPHEVPVMELKGMLIAAASIYGYMDEMEDMEVISLGYNNSPLNFGAQEEQGGGMQSLPTLFHFQFWNRRGELRTKPLGQTPENVQQFITGDAFNGFAAEIARSIFSTVPNSFIDTSSIEKTDQGLTMLLKTDLGSALDRSTDFAVFLKDLHDRLENAMAAVWDALTTSSYQSQKQIAAQGFEEGRSDALAKLQQPPVLRNKKDRQRRIAALPTKVFPVEWKEKLSRLSGFMRDRYETSEVDWIRNGLGFALVISQEKGQPQARLDWRPAVKITTSRGGVMEAQNLSLDRRIANGDSDDELMNNKRHVAEFAQDLPKSLRYTR